MKKTKLQKLLDDVMNAKFGTKNRVELILRLTDMIENPPFERFKIERMGVDANDHLTFIDMHDEKFGEAIFFGEGSRHHHGFLNKGKYI